MNESTSGVLALAVGGAAAGAAVGALVVSLLSRPPAMAPPSPELKKITITLQEDQNGKCAASFGSAAEKKVVLDDYEPGIRWEVFNEDCDQTQLFRVKEKRSTGFRPVPVRCRFHALVTADLTPGQSIDPFPECVFPLEKRYKGKYEYIVQLCKDDGSGCQDQDPEIEVKRR